MQDTAAPLPRRRAVLRPRLAIGFSLVLILLVVLCGVAIHRVNVIAGSLATINDTNSVKQRYAINFRGSVHDRAISVRDVVLVTEAAERDAALTDIKRLAAFYADSALKLDAMMATGAEVTPQEIQILASIKATEVRTMPLIDQVIALQQKGDGTAAHSMLLEQARPAFVEWLARINQFIDLEEAKNGVVAREARGVAEGFQTMLLLLNATGLAMGIGIAFWAMRAVAPLSALSETMLRLSRGEEQADIPGLGRRDEVGAMAEAVEIFRSQGVEAQRLRVQQEADRIAARQSQVDALMGMAEQVENKTLVAMNEIASNARNLVVDAQEMVAATARVDRNANAVGAAAVQSLSVAETVAAAAEELTTSIRGITEQVREAAEVSRGTAADSAQTEVVIVALSAAVGEIGDVTNLIQQIAGKTNLLALNATIEAARAGDAGKGFAVVAGEVKDLASQTATATQQISRHIEAVRSRTNAAVETVRRIAESVARMDQLAASLAGAVGEQNSATQEIARSIALATQAARDVTDSIGHVSTDAREAGVRAGNTEVAITKLADNAAQLTNQVVEILRTSVPEVDRRRSVRNPVGGTAVLVLDGRRSEVMVGDISSGGMSVSGDVIARIGQRGTVTLTGKPPMEVEVRQVSEKGKVGLSFTVEQSQRFGAAA